MHWRGRNDWGAWLATILLVLLEVSSAAFLPSVAGSPAPGQGPIGRVLPSGLVVLFDEAHQPVYSVNPDNPTSGGGVDPSGGYAQFAKRLEDATFEVRTLDLGQGLSDSSLEGVRVLVIASSQNVPYSSDELAAIDRFVADGGGLFLIGDHSEFAIEVEPIANLFDVSFALSLVHDESHTLAYPTTDPTGPVFLWFAGSQIHDSELTANISRIELYRTNFLDALPPDAQVVLTTSEDATYYTDASGNPTTGPGIGNTQLSLPNAPVMAIVPPGLTSGHGKIAVFCDSNIYETTEDRDGDGSLDLLDSDNALFGVSTVEWLADIPPVWDLRLSSADPQHFDAQDVSYTVDRGATVSVPYRLQNLGNIVDDYLLGADGAPTWELTATPSQMELTNRQVGQGVLTVHVPTSHLAPAQVVLNLTATSTGSPPLHSTMRVEIQINLDKAVRVRFLDSLASTDAGSVTSLPLEVTNLGIFTERFRLTPTSAPGFDASLEVVDVVLAPGGSQTFQMEVGTDPDLLGGTLGLVAITAALSDDPIIRDSDRAQVRIIQAFGFSLRTEEPLHLLIPGQASPYHLILTNLGNGNDRIAVGADPGSGLEGWSMVVTPQPIPLPFGSSVVLVVNLIAPLGATPNITYDIPVLGHSELSVVTTNETTIQGRVLPHRQLALEGDPLVRYLLPGQTIHSEVNLTNQGNLVDRAHIVLEEAAPGWTAAMVLRSEGGDWVALGGPLTMEPLERVRLRVEQTGPPIGQTPPWSVAAVSLTATSAIAPEVSDREVVAFVLDQVHNISLGPQPLSLSLNSTVDSGSSSTVLFPVVLRNDGAGDDIVRIEVGATPAGLQVVVPFGPYHLPAMAEQPLSLEVSLGGPMLAGTYTVPIALQVGLGDGPEGAWLPVPLAGRGERHLPPWATRFPPRQGTVHTNLTVVIPVRIGLEGALLPGRLTFGAGGTADIAVDVYNAGTVPVLVTLVSTVPAGWHLAADDNLRLGLGEGGRLVAHLQAPSLDLPASIHLPLRLRPVFDPTQLPSASPEGPPLDERSGPPPITRWDERGAFDDSAMLQNRSNAAILTLIVEVSFRFDPNGGFWWLFLLALIASTVGAHLALWRWWRGQQLARALRLAAAKEAARKDMPPEPQAKSQSSRRAAELGRK